MTLRFAVIAGALAVLLALGAAFPARAQEPTPDGGEDCLLTDPITGNCLMPVLTCPELDGENEPWPIIADWGQMHVVNAIVNWLFWPLTVFLWWVEKITAAVTDFLMQTSVWESIWTSLMDGLRGLYGGGGALERIMFGATGLVYLALGWAGISMMLPFQTKIARPEKVILWGVIVTALFTSAGTGFDMMNMIERQRMSLTATIMGAGDAQLSFLVAGPMNAGADDLADFSLTLPPAFAEQYFPEAETEEKEAIFRLGCVMGSPIEFTIPFEVEEREQGKLRWGLASVGFILALLTLAPAYVLGLFGVSFAVLSAAAILLMVFFLALLPVVFFEFSEPIVMGVIKQYLYIFALTILISVLSVILAAATQSSFPAGNLTVEVFVLWLPMLLIIGLMMSRVSGMAWNAMSGSFSSVSASVTAITSMSPAPASSPSSSPLGNAGALVATMGLAAATGGVGAALVAGAGQTMGNTGVGKAAGQMAAAGGGRKAQSFAAAARGGGGLKSTAGVVATNLRYNNRAQKTNGAGKRPGPGGQKAFEAAVSRQPARLDPGWGAVVSAGGLITADLNSLERAEKHHFKDKNPREARLELERAFGGGQAAQDASAIYKSKGRAGAAQLRRVTEIAQATALGMEERGERVFDQTNRPSPAYRQQVRQNLARAGAVDFSSKDSEELERWGRVAGAAVRRPKNIWSDDRAAHKLARDTLEPDRAEVKAGDISAQYRLRNLAFKMEWGEGQLASLYDAIRAGQAAAAQTGKPALDETVNILKQSSPFKNAGKQDLQEAARLGTLVADGAQIQTGRGVDLAQPVPLAAAFDNSSYKEAMKTNYRDNDPGKSRQILVRATGSHQAAETAQAAFEKHPPRAAAQLPAFINAAQDTPPKYDSFGVPAESYKQRVGDETVTGGQADESGRAFFDDVADDLLVSLNSNLLGETDKIAASVMGEADKLGTAARELKEIAAHKKWGEKEVGGVVAESLMGSSAETAAQQLPVFEGMDQHGVGQTMAAARDAAWEYQAAKSVGSE